MTPGVVGLNVPDVPSLTVAAGANPIPFIPEPTGELRFTSLTSEPKPRNVPSSGSYTVVPKQGYITLVARVAEPEGKAPTIWWTGEGKFSCKQAVTMD